MFPEKINEEVQYCTCQNPSAVSSETNDFGYRLVCCQCGKPIEDSFEYFNHYDGEDHCNDIY